MVSVWNCTAAHPPALALMMAGVSALGGVACNKNTLSRGGRRRSHTTYFLPDCVRCVFIYRYLHTFSGRSGIPLIHVNRLILNNGHMCSSASVRISCWPDIIS